MTSLDLFSPFFFFFRLLSLNKLGDSHEFLIFNTVMLMTCGVPWRKTNHGDGERDWSGHGNMAAKLGGSSLLSLLLLLNGLKPVLLDGCL